MGIEAALIGSTVGSALLGARESRRASEEVADAQEAAAIRQEEATQQMLERLTPYSEAGQAAIPGLLQQLGVTPLEFQPQTIDARRAELEAELAGLESEFDDFRQSQDFRLIGATNPLLQPFSDRGRARTAELTDNINRVRSELASLPTPQAPLSTAQPMARPDSLEPRILDLIEQGGTYQLPSEDIFQNPLMRAISDETTRQLTASQASQGRLGSGGTAEELQRRLTPTALNLGLTLADRQRQARQDTIRGLLGIQGAREARDETQTNNLFRLLGIGQASSAGQAATIGQGTQAASQALINAAMAEGQGRLSGAQQLQQGVGDVAGITMLSRGGYFNQPQVPQSNVVAPSLFQNVTATPASGGTLYLPSYGT